MKPFATAIRRPRHAPIELEKFIPYQLSIVSNTVSEEIAREYRERFELGTTEWRVMAVLARYDGEGLSARAVARLTAMDKVAISRALARLVEKRRVLRRVHHGDKRRSVLRLSAAGWRIHGVVAPLARQHERVFLEKLSEDERRSLASILDKLMAGEASALRASTCSPAARSRAATRPRPAAARTRR